MPYYNEEKRHVYKLKHSLKRENHVILIIITTGKKWHYLAALLREKTSKNVGDFYFLNCFHSYNTKKNLKNILMHVKIMIILM